MTRRLYPDIWILFNNKKDYSNFIITKDSEKFGVIFDTDENSELIEIAFSKKERKRYFAFKSSDTATNQDCQIRAKDTNNLLYFSLFNPSRKLSCNFEKNVFTIQLNNDQKGHIKNCLTQLRPYIKAKAELPTFEAIIFVPEINIKNFALYQIVIKNLGIRKQIIPYSLFTKRNYWELIQPIQKPKSISNKDASIIEFRERIEAVDRKLLELLSQRFSIINEIGEIKFEKNLEFFDPDRFGFMLKSLKGLSNSLKLEPDFIESIYVEIQIQSLVEMILHTN